MAYAHAGMQATQVRSHTYTLTYIQVGCRVVTRGSSTLRALVHARTGSRIHAHRRIHTHVLLFCRYDVEQFQKIEHLTGVKMGTFPAERDEVCVGMGDCVCGAV